MKIKAVKPFDNIEKEADFWDSHDLSKAIKDPKIPLSKLLFLEPKKEVVMTLRIQKAVKDRIESLAKLKGINPATLSRMWLIEKLGEIEKAEKKYI
jgi:hypothetical protein